jgi:hypothetical protein
MLQYSKVEIKIVMAYISFFTSKARGARTQQPYNIFGFETFINLHALVPQKNLPKNKHSHAG